MVYLTVMYQTDRDGMMLRTRAHHVADMISIVAADRRMRRSRINYRASSRTAMPA